MNFLLFNHFYQRLLFLLPFTTETFNYDDTNKWIADFPTCGGFKQSPISITTHKTFDVILPPLTFGYYDVYLSNYLYINNNGRSVEFEVPNTVLGVRPYITGGLLHDIYEVDSVHFHWGSPTHKGSEHILNGKRYDMEMHIVHKNARYADTTIARQFKDGLAVIAVFFKVVRSSLVYFPGLNEIYDTIEHLTAFNTTANTKQLQTLDTILGNINRNDFYTYKGSLTTPPCSEAVTWIVFPDALPISFLDLLKFWNKIDARGRPVLNNFRPLQSEQFHKVYHRYPEAEYAF